MADLEKTISIIFNGVDEMSSVVSKISGELTKFSNSANAVASPLASVATGVLKTEAAMTTLAAGGIAYAISKYADFEDVMLKVSSIMGADDTQYKELTETVQQLGATTRYTAEEAAEGMQYLAMAGLSVEEGIGALPSVLQLAAAAAVDLGDAADITTNIMTGYGLQVEDLERVNDVLVATFTSSNTSLEELGNAFKYVGPVASSMGLSIEETSAVLGVFANAGIKGEQAGTSLRNILLALVAPSTDMEKLLKKLGVSSEEMGIDLSSSKSALESLGVTVKNSTTGELRPFADILEDLKVGLEKIEDPADRTATLIEIFGRRGGPQVAALLQQGSDAVVDLREKIESLDGVAEKIAAAMESGVGGALREFRSSLDSVILALGKEFGEASVTAIDGATDLSLAIKGMVDDGSFDPVIDIFEKFSNRLGEWLKEFAKDLPDALEDVDFKDFEASIDGLIDSILGLFDIDDTSSTTDVLQGVVDTLTTLTKTSAGIINALEPFGELIVDLVDWFNDLDEGTQDTIATILGMSVVTVTMTTVTNSALSMVKGFTGIYNQVVKLGPSALTMISNFGGLSGVKTTVATLGAKLLALVPAIAAVGVGFGTGWAAGEAIKEMFPSLDTLGEKLAASKNKVLAMSDAEMQAANETEILTGKIKELPESIQSEIKTLYDSQGFDAAIKAAYVYNQDLSELPESVQTEIKAAIEQGNFDYAKSLINAIPEDKEMSIAAKVDETAKKDTEEDLKKIAAERQAKLKAEADAAAAAAAKQKLDEAAERRLVELELQGDIDKELEAIKATADTVQTAMEWEAKVDIAEAEAAAASMESAFDSVGESVSATASAVSDMFGDLVGNWSDLDFLDKWQLSGYLEEQMEMERDALTMQQQLVDAQVEYMREKSAALENGQALITITADGLDADLQMVLNKIIEKAQVAANEEGLEQLLGS